MRRTAWMPLYVDDLTASTTDMSCDQFGAYVRLLCHLWSRGPLPQDEAVICRVAGCRRATWKAISKRFSVCTRDDGTPGLSQTRLEAERMKRHAFMEERSASGRRGASQRWHGSANGSAIRSADGSPMASHNHNHISNTGVSSTTRSSEAAPAPLRAGLPRLRSGDEDDREVAARNRAFIRRHKGVR